MVKVLLDTNILVDYLNGQHLAKAEIERYSDKAVSVITVMEVLIGETPDSEGPVRRFLNGFQHLPIDAAVSEAAIRLRRAHKIKLPDAIIWATAQVHGRILITRNTKDFVSGTPGLHIPYRLLP